jgi:predicted lactoylglutathione lyase
VERHHTRTQRPSRDEVDDVIEQARANGGTIAREPAETFYGGYAGVFRDLDGHAWEFLSC